MVNLDKPVYFGNRLIDTVLWSLLGLYLVRRQEMAEVSAAAV